VRISSRILNPKAARSQVIGAMTMGVGELVVDKRISFFVNHDLALYEGPSISPSAAAVSNYRVHRLWRDDTSTAAR
jgi:CO/xanthine dehydrogenase Mo-binding subunit